MVSAQSELRINANDGNLASIGDKCSWNLDSFHTSSQIEYFIHSLGLLLVWWGGLFVL